MTLKTTLLLSLSLNLVGCSILRPDSLSKRKFDIDRLWTRSTIEKLRTAPQMSHRMQPLLYENLVIQGNGAESIIAYDQTDGQMIWSVKVEGGVEAGATVFGNSLYFGGNDGKFYAVDILAGKVLWTFPVRAQVLAAPLALPSGVYFLSGDNVVYGLDHSGKQKWVYKRSSTGSLSIRGGSQPSSYQKRLFIGSSDGYLVSIDQNDGQLIWERQLAKNTRFTDVDASPIISDDKVYVSSYDGVLFCLSRDDGQVVWRFDHGGHHAVTIDGDVLYFSTSDGFVFALNKNSGKEIWKYKVPSGIATKPILYKGLLVLGESDGPLRFLSARTGEALYHFHTGRGISAEPQLNEATSSIYTISNDGLIYALKADWSQTKHDWPWIE